MNYKELKKELKKRLRKNPKWRRGGSITEDSMILVFSFGRKFGILKHFEYDGWHIEEQLDGSWKTYYKERREETFISLYPSEDIACKSFLQEIDPYNYASCIFKTAGQSHNRFRVEANVSCPIITQSELNTYKLVHDNSVFIFIDNSIKSDAALRLFINKCIKNPHGEDDDWNGISKALKDLSWITEKSIIIILIQFPCVDGQTLQRFLSVIDSAESYWREERKNITNNMKHSYLEFYVLENKGGPDGEVVGCV